MFTCLQRKLSLWILVFDTKIKFRDRVRPVCDAKIGGNGVGDVSPAYVLNGLTGGKT